MASERETLNEVFYDPRHAGSFSSVQKIYKSLKNEGHNIPTYKIREWLQSQETHTLQRGVRRKFKRNRVMVYGIDSQWDADLMDLSQIGKYNKSFKYVLLCIDILSKYTWVVPMKSKTGEETLKAFRKIFAQGRKPRLLRTDQGKEFLNNKVSTLFKAKGIHHFVTENELHSNVAERCIKTLKNRIFKYFTRNQTYKYIDVLQDIVYSYNRTYHRSIRRAPVDVNKDNEVEVWQQLYLPFKKPKSTNRKRTKKVKPLFNFDIGDSVRISHLKKAFEREYHAKWTEEVFKIKSRRIREGIPVYKLIDIGDDVVQGSFYEAELQKVVVNSNTLYKIEEILKTRKRKKKTEYYVKWLSWPSKFNSWIDSSDVEQYKN